MSRQGAGTSVPAPLAYPGVRVAGACGATGVPGTVGRGCCLACSEGRAAVCAGGRRPAREPSALRFLAFLLRVVTNVVNRRCFLCGFPIRCYKRRQSNGFFAENSGFWTQIDDVCNVVRPPALRLAPAAPSYQKVACVLDRKLCSG